MNSTSNQVLKSNLILLITLQYNWIYQQSPDLLDSNLILWWPCEDPRNWKFEDFKEGKKINQIFTFGNIVPCLSPVSNDLKTVVTSSNSLLVNSSGWFVILLFTLSIIVMKITNLSRGCKWLQQSFTSFLIHFIWIGTVMSRKLT